MRIGHGYDAHRLREGRRCVLCGMEIPCAFGPDGHSDADVPAHALIDAILGAAALGDIGAMFPDGDGRWLDADSMELLASAYGAARRRGYALVNADVTIIAQRPRLAEHIPQMRARLAAVLGADIGAISVKATTEEGMGFTGDGTGISAHAVVLLE